VNIVKNTDGDNNQARKPVLEAEVSSSQSQKTVSGKRTLRQSSDPLRKAKSGKKKKDIRRRRRRRKRKGVRSRSKKIPQSKEKISITPYQRKNLDFVYSYALENGFDESNWKNVAKSIRRIRKVKVEEAIEKKRNRLSSGLNLIRMKFFNLPRVCLKKSDQRKIAREIKKKLKTLSKRGYIKYSPQVSSHTPTKNRSSSLPLPRVVSQDSDSCFMLDLSDARSTSSNSSLNMTDLNEEAQNQVLDKFLTLFGA